MTQGTAVEHKNPIREFGQYFDYGEKKPSCLVN